MGCVCSKQEKRHRERTIHMVALTSTTLGVLELGSTSPNHREEETTKGLQDVRSMNWVEKSVIEEETELDPVIIDAWELMEGLHEDVGDSPAKVEKKIPSFHTIQEIGGARKENATPAAACHDTLFLRSGKQKMEVSSPLRELNVNNCMSSPRRVSDGSMADLKAAPRRRLNSRFRLSIDLITEPDSPLFSPCLVASLEKALDKLSEEEWNVIKKGEEEGGVSAKEAVENFEEKCPPGGGNAVVLYTTTLRGIRKTFEECNKVRDALESYGICMSERDVSMHLEFRNELRRVMGKLVTVPRVFIKGRYIGGADDLLRLHEEGNLGGLLRGIPTQMPGRICDGCGGVRFLPCLECSGSCKLVNHHNVVVRCPDCNENGLIQCPICT